MMTAVQPAILTMPLASRAAAPSTEPRMGTLELRA